jgi:hypothetical protein
MLDFIPEMREHLGLHSTLKSILKLIRMDLKKLR